MSVRRLELAVLVMAIFCATAGAAAATWTGTTITSSASFTSATFTTPASPSVVNFDCSTSLGSRVQLSWTGAGGSGNGIDLLRATSSGGPYTDLGVQNSSIATGNFVSPYLSKNTTYWFELRTTVSGGTWFSAATSPVSVTTLNC